MRKKQAIVAIGVLSLLVVIASCRHDLNNKEAQSVQDAAITTNKIADKKIKKDEIKNTDTKAPGGVKENNESDISISNKAVGDSNVKNIDPTTKDTKNVKTAKDAKANKKVKDTKDSGTLKSVKKAVVNKLTDENKKNTNKSDSKEATKKQVTKVIKNAPASKETAKSAKPGTKKAVDTVKKDAPAIKKDAPAIKKDAPVIKKDVPVVKKPAPVVKKPAPVVKKSGVNTESKPVITTKIITDTKAVPFKTIYKNDSNLAKGTTKITTNGINGVRTIKSRVTYTDGKETGRQIISDIVTKTPVNKVALQGTKAVTKDVYTEKTETVVEVLHYKTIKQETNTLPKGEIKIVKPGKVGSKISTVKVFYKNGKEYKREVVSSNITQKPVDAVMQVGTKVVDNRYTYSLATERSILINKINNFRKQYGLKPLTINAELNSLAQKRAIEMGKAGLKGHTRPNGSAWNTIAGSDKRTDGGLFLNLENIAYPNDFMAPGARAFTDWVNSAGHNANMRNTAATHAGFGISDITLNGNSYRIVVFIGGHK